MDGRAGGRMDGRTGGWFRGRVAGWVGGWAGGWPACPLARLLGWQDARKVCYGHATGEVETVQQKSGEGKGAGIVHEVGEVVGEPAGTRKGSDGGTATGR